jgi:DNA (cytosine-5)-methyltransferase 1
VGEMRRNAVEFGVAQTRERVFVLGSKANTPLFPEALHHLPGETASSLQAPITAGQALAKCTTEPEPEEVVTGRWAQHLQEVRPGWNYKHHTAWGGHPRPTWETETRFWNFLLKLAPERPSWTIAANPGPWTGPFHWESRRLRIDEMAALQGFPPGYQITGNRRQRVRQMGNAVPPPMAHRMAEAVLRSLGHA